MKEMFFALWFFLPAGIASDVPILMTRIPGLKKWNTPLDFGKTLRGKRIFGDSKTWRGLICGTITAGVVGAIQYWLFPQVGLLHINFPNNWILFGAIVGGLIGFGALVGDAIESSFKRQLGIKPGQAWFPFDQIDYIIGGLAFSAFMVQLRSIDYITILVTWFVMHLIFSYIGYRTGFKSKPI